VAQENQHLMTEQLSAYLDKRPLSAEEQNQVEAHLKTCEQCQQELADLRHTVALLHALPQPALPRSFMLPLDINIQTDIQSSVEDEHEKAEPVPIAVAVARRRRREADTGNRGWPTYVRVALRTVSAIAAVVGLALLLSGMIGSFSPGATMTASYSRPMAANSSTQDSQTSSSSGKNAQGSTAAPQLSPSSRETITPPAATASTRATPLAEATATTAITHAETPAVNKAAQPVPRIEPSRSPIILFFDLSTGPGRLGFGFLLLLLGVMGYIVFKRRWRQERT
jgi:anti-sigma factor RsiW